MTDHAAAYQRAKLKYYGLPVPPHLKHGQSSRAANIYGCDCKLCLPSGRRMTTKMTHAERQRKLRQAKRGKPLPPGTKHGVYAYRVYGCRCDFCVHTFRKSHRGVKQSWRTRATGVWGTGVDAAGFPVDVLHWPPVGTGTWTCPDCNQRFPHRPPKEARLAA